MDYDSSICKGIMDRYRTGCEGITEEASMVKWLERAPPLNGSQAHVHYKNVLRQERLINKAVS